MAPGDDITIDPSEIDVREASRLRPIDYAWAEAIGQSMKRDGQIHRVEVRRTADGGWELPGAGGHRTLGAQMAGIQLECTVVTFGDDTGRRREAAENLFRRANDPVERAEAIAELVRLHRAKAGIREASRREKSVPKTLSKTLQEEAAVTLDTMSNVYGWSDEVASELGFSSRTIRRDLYLYRCLRPSVIALFRENKHPALKNAAQLRQLAKLKPADQDRVAARMIDRGYGDHARTVAGAILLLGGTNRRVDDPADKRFNAIVGTLHRMSHAERLALVQSPTFQDLLPSQARDLLAPIRRDEEDGQ